MSTSTRFSTECNGYFPAHPSAAETIRQKKAYILNISSIAALASIGYKTVYPASKAF
jgi:short-subunit dehydrogenase